MADLLAPPTEDQLRAEEARLLRERASGSARSVLILIALIAVSLISVGLWQKALIWAALASAMVGVTVYYARSYDATGETPARVNRYLLGHVLITGTTGLLWTLGALQLASPTSELRTFMAGLFLTSITAGGVMAGTIYRPGYLALAFASVVPFSLTLVITTDGVLRIYGFFLLLYFGFCVTTNKTASRKSRDAVAAKLVSRNAEQALKAFAEAAKEHRQTKRSVAAIQHDMAQPLLALRNFLTEMDRQANTPDQAVLVHQIRMALISQEALVEELASVQKTTEDAVAQAIDLDELLAQLRAEYAPQLAAQNCQLIVQSDVATIWSDQAGLERILRNLLSNTVRYAASGESVTLQVRAQDGSTLFTVADQGPGLSTDLLQAMQNGVTQVTSDQGKGLGLGISRQLAEALGGELTFATPTEGGTAITLRLPGTAPDDSAQSAFILCVGHEDLPHLGVWADLISMWIWEFAHATTCAEAQDLITTLRLTPDLIVLDPLPDAPCTPAEVAALAKIAPVIHLKRGSGDIEVAHVTKSEPMPGTEAQLRKTLEDMVQNSASSRAR